MPRTQPLFVPFSLCAITLAIGSGSAIGLIADLLNSLVGLSKLSHHDALPPVEFFYTTIGAVAAVVVTAASLAWGATRGSAFAHMAVSKLLLWLYAAACVIVRRSFWIQHDGELEFRAINGAATHTKTIDGYVTNSMGGHTTVTINPDGTISVSNKNA